MKPMRAADRGILALMIFAVALEAFLQIALDGSPSERIGAGIPVVVVLPLMFRLWRTLRRRRRKIERLRKKGIHGTAQIVTAEPTGTIVNGNRLFHLKLAVTTQLHGTYLAETTDFLPFAATMAVSTGAVAVLVDPEDGNSVMIAWDMPPPLPAATRDAERERLLREGLPGRMRILEATPVGRTDELGFSLFDLTVVVEVDSRPTMASASRTSVPPGREPRMRAGEVLAVRVDPHNAQSLAVDWSAS